jgi:hypothetical protein
MGPPVASGYYQRVGIASGQATSFGHAPSLDRGLWYAAHQFRADWALVLDGDVLLLDPALPVHLRAAVERLDRTTIVVGEWVGTPEDWTQPHWASWRWHGHGGTTTDKGLEPVPAAIRAYGYVNMMCSVVDLAEFWAPEAVSLQNTGWVANQWFYSQMARGKRSAYSPFFRNESAVHIGGVAVATTQQESFGNIQGGRRYGQREQGNYYAGYLQVLSEAEFIAALRHRAPGALLARSLFGPPVPMPPQWEPQVLSYAGTLLDERLDAEVLPLGFYLLDPQDDWRPLAKADVECNGPAAKILDVQGTTDAHALACYEAVFEHTAALMRPQVWTPTALAQRLGSTREVHEVQGEWNIRSWRYFGRGTPQWRWAEHFGWGRALTGPLEVQTR